MAIYIRECIQCGAAFKGGPRAWYCPECRAERIKQADREAKKRKSEGKVRKIGSTDFCKRCGKPYTVNSGKQMYCPECSEEAVKEIDRQQALEYYYENKEVINNARNIKRRVPARRCAICGKDFEAKGPKKYCSPECAKKAHKAMEPIYAKRVQEKKKAEKEPKE